MDRLQYQFPLVVPIGWSTQARSGADVGIPVEDVGQASSGELIERLNVGQEPARISGERAHGAMARVSRLRMADRGQNRMARGSGAQADIEPELERDTAVAACAAEKAEAGPQRTVGCGLEGQEFRGPSPQ